MKTIIDFLKVFVILIASFLIFSVVSVVLPLGTVQKNIKKSLPEMEVEVEVEGNFPKTILYGPQWRTDNGAETLILNVIVSGNASKPINSVMTVPYTSLCPETEWWDMIKHLQHKIENPDLTPNSFYGRQWFGSAAVFKILLFVMTYQEIRLFLWIVSSLLLMMFAVKIVKEIGWIKSTPIFISLLFANLFVTQFSLFYLPVIMIALISSILMCENALKKRKKIALFLFATGMFTAYFDLLTIPLLTLGLPLIIYLIITGTQLSAKIIFKNIFILSFAWFAGYAGAWVCKWILAVILAGTSTIDAVISQVTVRTTSSDINGLPITRFDAIIENIKLLPFIWLDVILTPLFILTLFFFNKKNIALSLAFLFIGIFPYVWYFILANHSHFHSFFTYRLQIISTSCIMLFFIYLIDWKKLKSFVSAFYERFHYLR